MKLSKWQTFKINIAKFYNSKWRNHVVLSSLAAIFALAIIIPIVIVLTKPKLTDYAGPTEVNLIERFDGSKIQCTENSQGNGMYWCRRGPVIISAPARGSNASLLKFNLENFKDKNKKDLLEQPISINDLKQPFGNTINYNDSWGILPELVNWFYENVAWGPEILSFNTIDIMNTAIRRFFNEIAAPSVAFNFQYYPKYIAGPKLVLPFFNEGSNKEINKYLETKDDKYNPILNRFDDFKFYLTQAYLTYKISWYTQDRSSTYRLGGATERKENREILNRYSEFSYLNERFKNVKTQVKNIKFYNRQKAYDVLDKNFKNEIETGQLNFKNKGDGASLTYLDLYALANNDNNLTTTKSFELSSQIEGNKITNIYDGIDYFSNIVSELTIFQLENANIFNEIKKIKINLNNDKIDEIGKLNKTYLESYLESNSIKDLITSKIRYRGYKIKWLQDYFEYLLLPLILLNSDKSLNDIHYDGDYTNIQEEYHGLENKPKWAITSIKYVPFNDAAFETEDGFKRGLIEAPGYMSTTNYYNQLKFLVNRDLMTLTTDNNLFKKSNNEYIDREQRLHNPYFKDLNLLNNFGANPYKNDGNYISDEIKVDGGVINGLQKLLRMNSDISMSHLSEDSERSYLWGYVDADQDINSLKFTNTETGENKYIKVWTQESLDKQYNCPSSSNNECQQRQSLLGNEYIYKKEPNLFDDTQSNSKILLNDITSSTLSKPKKLWVSNFAVIADYANAIFQGNYKVSFSSENDSQSYEIKFDQKMLDYALDVNNENHILNSNADMVAHAGWWFYRKVDDATDKNIYFRVIGGSWLK